MHIYKFRVLSEDNDNFFREIDIKPSQTFEDFHRILLECTGFEPGEMASFYMCDNQWRKLQEISLENMSIGMPPAVEEDEKPSHEEVPLVMADTRLRDCINDPHQRMIYVYDFLNLYTFYIELYKIADGDEGASYPRCVKSTGKIQKNVKNQPPEAGIAAADDENNPGFEEIVDEDELPGSENMEDFGEYFEGNTYN